MSVTIVAELQFICLNIPHRYSKGISSSLTEDNKEDKQAPPSTLKCGLGISHI